MLSSRMQRGAQHESVGQLFTADLTKPTVTIEEATVLQPRRASRASVSFDSSEMMRQREEFFRRRLFCVGVWHTHPEPNPQPSTTDALLAADHAKAARPVLNGLVFAIVGTRPFPAGWYVGVHDGLRLRKTNCKRICA